MMAIMIIVVMIVIMTKTLTLKIGEMEDTFDLVLVVERWDESMVLLKHLLCWEIRSPHDYMMVCRDVVNFKLNARKESKKVVLSGEARAALRSLVNLT